MGEETAGICKPPALGKHRATHLSSFRTKQKTAGDSPYQEVQKQFVEFMTSLYREGFLDDQFVQLQKLQDESNPDFVSEVMSLFFEDSEKLLDNLATALQRQPVDFQQVDAFAHQFKGSSSRCLSCLQHVKREYYLVKNRLETLFRLERQILAAGGKVPVVAWQSFM